MRTQGDQSLTTSVLTRVNGRHRLPLTQYYLRRFEKYHTQSTFNYLSEGQGHPGIHANM